MAIGVRERCALDLARWSAPARLRPARTAVRAAVRGPVHADAAPILVGLSLVVAALVTAVDHVLAALRRVAARRALARRARPLPALPRPLPATAVRRPARIRCANLTRGPPAAPRPV